MFMFLFGIWGLGYVMYVCSTFKEGRGLSGRFIFQVLQCVPSLRPPLAYSPSLS